nr:DUF411 domain-containing protein [uncultured Aureimonas sp.]
MAAPGMPAGSPGMARPEGPVRRPVVRRRVDRPRGLLPRWTGVRPDGPTGDTHTATPGSSFLAPRADRMELLPPPPVLDGSEVGTSHARRMPA